MTLKECIRHIELIEFRTKKTVRGIQAGAHGSLFKGQGIEFARIREYIPGDDTRAIDWNVTARLGNPYVREYAEDRDQTVYFVVDRSASGTFGSRTSKEVRMLEVCATLMFAALHNNDAVGLCIFTDSVERFIPAHKGRTHCIILLNTLITHTPHSKKTDLGAALQYLCRSVRRRCSVVLISDFGSENYARPLGILSGRHDFNAIVVSDPAEYALPDIGLVELEDPETGDQLLVDTSDPLIRKRFEEVVQEAEERRKKVFTTSNTPAVNLRTDESSLAALKKLFGSRRGCR
jgi:uncharacterized protein (DUF58 family)